MTSGFAAQGTGSVSSAPKTISVALDQYEVVLAVTEDDRVLGILEVRVKKDFRNIQQKVASTGYIDLEQFVKE
ncbi:MAG: hypothetical protein WBG19_05645 [Thermoplasmata archaeon]